MSHRKLTKQKVAAMRDIIERRPVFSRGIAVRLREIERDFPHYLEITPSTNAGGARPFFCARLTAAGLAAITPRKLARRIAAEVHA